MEATQQPQNNVEHNIKGQDPSQRTKYENAPSKGITIDRYFTQEGQHPYDEVEWERRVASIVGQDGKPVFEQKDVEIPKKWSQTATNIVAQKYFHGPSATHAREESIRQVFDRVVDTIRMWGEKQGYFKSETDAKTFGLELKHLLVNRKGSFNSPVWFNVGIDEHPQ